jgi:hypothetical protein
MPRSDPFLVAAVRCRRETRTPRETRLTFMIVGPFYCRVVYART